MPARIKSERVGKEKRVHFVMPYEQWDALVGFIAEYNAKRLKGQKAMDISTLIRDAIANSIDGKATPRMASDNLVQVLPSADGEGLVFTPLNCKITVKPTRNKVI